jgi:hypothetical protein
MNKTRQLAYFGLSLPKVSPGIAQQLHLPVLVLEILTRVWKFDRLALWKYAKYLELAEKKIMFAPYNTHLSKFDWYKKNEESFFHPDEAPIDIGMFEFEVEGTVLQNGLKKIDRIGIPIIDNIGMAYMQCLRKEEHYPVYISEEIYKGMIRSCLLKYDCPMWIRPFEKGDFKADVYINGILYWLHELFDYLKPYMAAFGQLPISIVIGLEEEYYNIEKMDNFETSEDIPFRYGIKASLREITIILPKELIGFLISANNYGEQRLMDFFIDALGFLKQELGIGSLLDQEEKEAIIRNGIPLGQQKIIIVVSSDRDIKISGVDLVDARNIPDADISFVLENQVSWLNLKNSIPATIKTAKEKTQLLNSLVGMHFNKVTMAIARYDAISFLMFLMKRHESLLQERSFRKLNYPVKKASYGKFYDVFEEFESTEAALNQANLAMRVLIEFTACMMPWGNETASDDDVDMMLAQVIELINYGSISDEIKFNIHDPEIGLLPSGRIGIKKNQNGYIKPFRKNVNREEFDSYAEKFDQFFHEFSGKQAGEVKEKYSNKVNIIFKEEWGIELFDIYRIADILTLHLFKSNKSLDLISGKSFYEIIQNDSELKEDEITAFIKRMAFIERESILKPPVGYILEETYPWRYDRRLSYVTRPLLPVNLNGEIFFLLSARHLLTAAENLIAMFFKGTLRIDENNKKIRQLLAERNHIKGAEYRKEVYEWLASGTSMVVYPYEIKISPRGFFKSEKDKGDIDILAIDKQKKIVYSIECKNTAQSKVAYEFHLEIEDYLGRGGKEGLIQKHVNRHTWLMENKAQVLDELKLSPDYTIESLVVSKNILPMKYIRLTPMPVYAFYDLKLSTSPFN